MRQAQPLEQLQDSQAHKFPQKHEADTRAWVWAATPETPTQHESKPNMLRAGHYDSIHGDFDAVDTTPKTTVPTLTTSGPNATGNACCLQTPLSSRDLNAGNPPGRSPAPPVCLSASPAKNANRPPLRPFLLSPLSGGQKRHFVSELSPLAQVPKRQRMLPSGPANPPQAKTSARPDYHFKNQSLQSIPVISANTALSSAKNGPTSSGEMAVERVGVRQPKGAGLRIDTQAAGLAASLPPRISPTHMEKLYADYVRTHKILRQELDNVTHEIYAANERANRAESQVRKAESMAYQANSANFQKLKELEDKHRTDIYREERRYRWLEVKFAEQRRGVTVLEARCKSLDWTIGELKRELEQERQGPHVCVSQSACKDRPGAETS